MAFLALSKSLIVLLFVAVLQLQGCTSVDDFDESQTAVENEADATNVATYTVVAFSIGISGDITLAAVQAAEPGIAAGIANFTGLSISASDVKIRSSQNSDRRLALLQRRLANSITVDCEIRVPADMFADSLEYVLKAAENDTSDLFDGIARAIESDNTVVTAMLSAGYDVSQNGIRLLMVSMSAPAVREVPMPDEEYCDFAAWQTCVSAGSSQMLAAADSSGGCAALDETLLCAQTFHCCKSTVKHSEGGGPAMTPAEANAASAAAMGFACVERPTDPCSDGVVKPETCSMLAWQACVDAAMVKREAEWSDIEGSEQSSEYCAATDEWLLCAQTSMCCQETDFPTNMVPEGNARHVISFGPYCAAPLTNPCAPA